LAAEDAGRFEEAIACYRDLLATEPRNADAWHNHGLLLARQGRLEEAAESHRNYLRAQPGSARACSDLADVLLALGDYEGAIAALDQAEREEGTALVRRGLALACLRRFEEARAAFKAARAADADGVLRFTRRIAPDADLDAVLSPENIFVSRAYGALGDCDWTRWTACVEVLRECAANPSTALEPAVGFMSQHLPVTARDRLHIARHIARRIEATHIPLAPPAPRSRSRIRVALLSPDFREHLNAYLTLPLFELLDRSKFELHAYALQPDDGSAIRKRLRAAADRFVELHALSDEQAALAIRGDDIDILVDIAGHTTGGRFGIVVQRPARVQASWLGFLGSLGSHSVDFAIADAILAPQPEEWAERLVHVPHSFFLYDFRRPAPQASLSRAAYGLPGDAFVYCAFHKAEKIGPDSFALWMRVLHAVPESVLWFRALSPAAEANLRAAGLAAGVSPKRLIFSPLERGDRYIARHGLGDLLLDALHHNAATNCCDALAGGLPVLTLRGSAAPSRVGESILVAAGLGDLVAADQEQFVEMAVSIGKDTKKAKSLKHRLSSNRAVAPFFDTSGRVRDLEACFMQMLEIRGSPSGR